MAGRRLDAEEAALWARVKASVRPLHPRPPRVVAKAPPEPEPAPLPGKRRVAVEPPPAIPSRRATALSPSPSATLDGSWDRRITRGTVQPDATLGEALLTPTRIYVKPLLAAIRACDGIKALAHITGGGFPDNIPRVLPDTLSAEIDLDAITVPPVFSWLAKTGGVEAKEMLRTFNCGIGMIAVVTPDKAAEAEAVLAAEGEQVVRLGRMVARQHEGVTYKGRLAL